MRLPVLSKGCLNSKYFAPITIIFRDVKINFIIVLIVSHLILYNNFRKILIHKINASVDNL